MEEMIEEIMAYHNTTISNLRKFGQEYTHQVIPVDEVKKMMETLYKTLTQTDK